MPIAQRQSSLFMAEDWRVFYRTFTQVNFSAYDFDTIRSAMIDYIRHNFPEDFNDWIESSEFIAIIELLAYLGQSLAFRVDLNMRENFLDTAEKRESILKLARFVSYTPSRNIAAQGKIKVTQITTTQSIFDSNGSNLSNRVIQWDDPNNPDWYEQFILILNNVFNTNNPFGRPLKTGKVSGIDTQLYALNNIAQNNNVYPFTANVNNNSYSFEVTNINFGQLGELIERNPDPLESFHLIYQNDGKGNASENTGFFFMFKQGIITSQDFTIDTPIENRVINIQGKNINNTDVFVQEIDQDGFVLTQWKEVPSVIGNNIIFNSINSNIRDIFSVITKEHDTIAIRFPDGRFGNTPSGLFRIWTRESANERFVIKTNDMSGESISIPYTSTDANIYNVKFSLTLQSSIANAAPSESNTSIKQNAPQVFYTQNRMVNGEDYNIFPLQNPETANIKSINRIHSGFSRFIDINDPSGISQDVNLFAEDGLFYLNNDMQLKELPLPTSLSNNQITLSTIIPLSNEQSHKHFYYFNYPRHTISSPAQIEWVPATTAINSSTGYFVNPQSTTPLIAIEIGRSLTTIPRPQEFYIDEGSLIKFTNAGWVSVASIINNGLGVSAGILDNGDGAVQLAKSVNSDTIDLIIPNFRTNFSAIEISIIVTQLSLNNNFGLRYDSNTLEWIIITGSNLNIVNDFSLLNEGSITGLNEDASWLIRAEFSQTSWRFYTRILDYVFESDKQVRFYFDNNGTVIDVNTGAAISDFINILKVNPSYSQNIIGSASQFTESTAFPLGLVVDKLMNIQTVFRSNDGFISTRRIKLTFTDSVKNGIPDDPTIFETVTKLTNNNLTDALRNIFIDNTELFFEKVINNNGFQELQPTKKIIASFNTEPLSITKTNIESLILSVTSIPHKFINNEAIYIRDSKIFLIYDQLNNIFVLDTSTFIYNRGRSNLLFQWKHFAPIDNRIDPAITNIIDNFILTVSYDTDVRQWIDNNGTMSTMPIPPTTETLKILFSNIEKNKMLSDQIIWHPAKYKLLFGIQAVEELRSSFKITKVPGTEIPDGEIKSKVINSINEFFAIGNFDFGETFYFTELSSFVHHRLATIIGSIVIVPLHAKSNFGALFQVRSNPDEIFISSAKVSDIQIVNSFNNNILRIGN